MKRETPNNFTMKFCEFRFQHIKLQVSSVHRPALSIMPHCKTNTHFLKVVLFSQNKKKLIQIEFSVNLFLKLTILPVVALHVDAEDWSAFSLNLILKKIHIRD